MGVSRVAGGVVVAAGVAAGVVVGLFGLVGHLEAVGDLNSVWVVAMTRRCFLGRKLDKKEITLFDET